MSDKTTDKNQKVKPLSHAELTLFCEQIAMVLDAGISVYEGICMLQEEATSPAEAQLYQTVINAMDEQLPFSAALAQSGAFPSYMVQMIEIGEFAGRLDTVLSQLARYYKREQSMKESVRYAISYPLVMLVMMGIIIAVLVAKVLPIFNEVFQDLGSELTGFSKQVMQLGVAFSNVLPVIFVCLLVAVLGVFFVLRTAKGKAWFHQFQATFFLTKNLSNRIAVARFTAGMSLMLASGLDTQQSLEMVAPLLTHTGVAEKSARMQAAVAEGKGFAEAAAQQEIFPKIYSRMLGIGERTGNLDEVMENLAQRYETEVETSLSRIIALIEPSLVAVLSMVVGVILLAVMLPLMGIMSVM